MPILCPRDRDCILIRVVVVLDFICIACGIVISFLH